MKELDFDIFLTQDAGRAVYRGFLIYASFLAFQQLYTQVNHGAAKWWRFVEQELWRGSRCYVQMKPRLRLFYSAMICSFVPFGTR